MRNAIVQAPMRVDKVPYHPGRGAAADNQHDFGVDGTPVVPKMPQRLYEARFVRVKTREFVDKNNAALSLFEFKIQKFLKPRKRI